jgi:hypothetical protein
MGPVILFAPKTQETPTFTGWSRTSWVRCGFCECEEWLFYLFIYPCKWHHASSEKNVNCRPISPLTTDCRNQLQKWTLLAGSCSCKACIIYCCFIGFSNCVALLALDFETPLSWARHFSDFLGVCSSLAPVSCNFSASTQHLCFCFLSIKSLVDLSLITKLWIVCLRRTLSSWNIHHGFHRHFLADLHFTEVSHRNNVTLKYTAPWQNTLLTNCNCEQTANVADNCCPLLTNHKQIPIHELKHNAVKQSTKLITPLNSKHYQPSGILLHQQNAYAPHSRWCTGCHEPVNKGKNLPVFFRCGTICSHITEIILV